MSGDARAELIRIAGVRGESLANLSRLIGRNPAYLQQYVKRGSPRRLPELDRKLLSKYLGVDETRLGAVADHDLEAVPCSQLSS